MNYFEFYEIPESFQIDAPALKKKFYELSKRYHPDFFANEDDAKQHDILELSTLNNKAYQVLSNPARRMEYILQQHELLAEGDKYQLAPDFLMEMMDINERLTDAETPEQLGNIKAQIDLFEKELLATQNALVIDYESDSTANKELKLKGLKDIYFKQKYLLRIKDSLDTFAARFKAN